MIQTVVCPRLAVAALRGSAGKTALAVGLVAALRKQGRRVAPFKKGPDYIDPAWHALAAGAPCRSLDTFMMGREAVLGSFALGTSDADVAVVEGNRGLFDGMDAEGTHSTVELAKLIRTPLVLVCDCAKTSRTMAAMVLGCLHLDPEAPIAGVVLNHVRGARHEAMLTAAIEQACGIPVLGAIPRVDDLPIAERHLGLLPPGEHGAPTEMVGRLGEIVARHVDLDAVWRIASSADAYDVEAPDEGRRALTGAGRPRIGVIRDRAFWFYYPENLEALRRRGAELVMVDSIEADRLPDVDALYIGGGFPETQAEGLAENAAFRSSVRRAAEQGLPIYAECGGLVFLGQELWWRGRRWPMAGVLPAAFAVEARPQGHGYMALQVDRPNPFFESGLAIRGHEFHYSRICGPTPSAERLVMRVDRGVGIADRREGWLCGNVLATYGHVHALGTPQWADGLVRLAGGRSAKAADPVAAGEPLCYKR